MEKINFIINPISGGKSKGTLPQLISKIIDKNKFNVEINFTEYQGHAKVLAQEAVEDHVDYVIAVGGDGTINEIASELVHTSVTLGIIPSGSGNGLARHLHIPLSSHGALEMINKKKVVYIDAGKVNEKYFFCTAGIGFDAHIAHLFAGVSKRGLTGYVKAVLKSFIDYKDDLYSLEIEALVHKQSAFMITFANAAQFGNNAYIAPLADIQDGLLDVCVMQTKNKWQTFLMAYRLFARNIHLSKYIRITKTEKAIVERSGPGPVHLDGEPLTMDSNLNVEIDPRCLKVIAGL